MIESLHVDVSEASRVGEARRLAHGLASRLGFDDEGAGRVALVATEAATNLIRHAGHGELLVRGDRGRNGGRIELLSVDRGPGMADVDTCRIDGFSSGGGRGEGLGAMGRAASDFDIHSTPGAGTVVMARFLNGASAAAGARVEAGGLSVPRPGEAVCGDAWTLRDDEDATTVLVVDGLGHGKEAAEAADVAVAAFERMPERTPAETAGALHAALRPTRGAALAVARIEPALRRMRFCGIGNIAGAVVGPDVSRHLVSTPGIAGHTTHRLQEFHYDLPEVGWIVVHSDGVDTRWSLGNYRDLDTRHPLLAAGLIYRDHRRGRDDATVVVARMREARP